MLRKIFGLLLLLALFVPGRFSQPVYAQEDEPQLTILIEDDFDAPELWAVVFEEHYRTRYHNGTYEIANNLPGSFVSSVRSVGLNNVLVETDAAIEGPAGAFGVTCRWQNADNFYAALVGEGRVWLVRVQNGTAYTLSEQAWGGNMPARVGILCTGPMLHLLMNGEIVLSARVSSFAGGSAGMTVQAGNSEEVSVRFDRFLLAEVNPDLTETPVEFYPGIRPGERLYLVRPGDTLQEIADRFDLTVPVLMQRNPHILDPELVYVWQPLAIPGGAAFPAAIETAETVVIPETGSQQPLLIHPTDLHPNMGVPILHGEFENRTSWLSGDEAETETQEGIYRITNSSSSAFATSVRPIDLPQVHVEVEVQAVTGSTSGVACRWQDDSRYYAFVLRQGKPEILRVQEGGEVALASVEVDLENEDWYQIGANCDGSLLTMYVNGVAMLQAADLTYASGYFGLVSGPGGASEFRRLTVYLPASALVEE
jgi:LysM repeat protein